MPKMLVLSWLHVNFPYNSVTYVQCKMLSDQCDQMTLFGVH